MAARKRRKALTGAAVLFAEMLSRTKFPSFAKASRALKKACRWDKDAVVRVRGKIVRSCWDEGRPR